MTTDKTEVTAKETATKKTPATAKKAVKATSKPATKKPRKAPKIKVVRDSFTMPQNEYEEIAKIKDAFRKAGLPVKKSEVLRAGLKALGELNMAQMKRILAGLEKVKTGRTSKH
jgi:hypothetical protein